MININEGASVRLMTLLQEAGKICKDNGWPHVLLAVGPGREESRAFGSGGSIDLADPGMRPLLEGAGLPGFALVAADTSVRKCMAVWNERTESTESVEEGKTDEAQ